jgi:hypothetical protein
MLLEAEESPRETCFEGIHMQSLVTFTYEGRVVVLINTAPLLFKGACRFILSSKSSKRMG